MYRLPLIVAGAAQPLPIVDRPPLPVQALVRQDQAITVNWQANPPSKAIVRQGQAITVTHALRPQAIVTQGQTIAVRARPQALVRQDQSIRAHVRHRADLIQGQVITVTPSILSGWANGYTYQHEIRLPVWFATGPTVANFLLPVAEQRNDLKSVGNGGNVQSASGWDIRFETTGGVKLGHRLMRYGAATGIVVALVNMTRNLAATETIYMYTGKAGLGSSEEDAALARAGGWLAWFAGADGEDRTNQSHTLIPSGVGSGAIGLWPAATCDGINDKFTQASSSYLNGLADLTVISLHQATSTATKLEVFNVAVGAAAELSLHLNDTATDRLTAIAKWGASTYQYQSADDTQSTDPQAVCFVAEATKPVRMAINGVAIVAGQATGNLSGTSSVADTLEWGAGDRGDLQFWLGKLGFLGFCAAALPVGATESMTAALVDPRLVYGIGAPNTVAVTNRSPVAQSLRDQSAIGGQSNDWVASTLGYDANGDALTVVSGSVSLILGDGTVSRPSSTTVRYTPNGAYEGPFIVEYAVQDAAAKTSTGRIYGTVTAASSPSGRLDNPFNKVSAHHRPIGASAVYGVVPRGYRADTADPINRTTYYDPPAVPSGFANATAWLRATCAQLRLGSTDQGRKGAYPVASGDTGRRMDIMKKNDAGNWVKQSEVTLKMPAGDTTVGGTGYYYPTEPPPKAPDEGDYEYGFYPKNGGAADICVSITDFDYGDQQCTDIAEYPLGGNDTQQQTGPWCGAARLRWPGTILRGADVNDTNPGPIYHALNLTGCRHNNQGATDACHFMCKLVAWPAWGIDKAARDDTLNGNNKQNKGILPYGTRICVHPDDRAGLITAIGASNKRGLRLLDCFIYFGAYLADGQGQHITHPVSGLDRGILQLRCDIFVGRNNNGSAISGVTSDLQNALDLIRAKLTVMSGIRNHSTESELNAKGLPYAGGGGPLDTANPSRSTNTAYDITGDRY